MIWKKKSSDLPGSDVWARTICSSPNARGILNVMRDRSDTQHAKESEKGDEARTRAVRNILRDAQRQTALLPQRLESRRGDAQLKFTRVRLCAVPV